MSALNMSSKFIINTLVQPFHPGSDSPAFDLNGYPIKRFICTSCGDTFLVEECYEAHIQRRSIQIILKCSNCKLTPYTFYNRCALISHIRTHPQLNSQFVHISILPLTKCGFSEGQSNNGTSPQKCNEIKPKPGFEQLTESTSNKISVTNAGSTILEEESRTEYPCLCCGFVASSSSILFEHGREVHLTNELLPVCLICRNQRFQAQELLESHILNLHCSTLQCSFSECKKLTFPNSASLFTHLTRIHRLLIKEIKNDSSTNENFAMKVAPLNPSSNLKSLEHSLDFKSEKSQNLFHCIKCDFRSVVLVTLKCHLLLQHNIDDNFFVPTEELKFKNCSSNTCMGNYHNFICRICRLSCNDFNSLKQHERTHGMYFINSCRK